MSQKPAHDDYSDRRSEATGRSEAASRLALPALLVGAVAIALSPIFVRLSEVGPSATAFWRVALALPVLILLQLAAARRRGGRLLPQRTADFGRLVLCGLLFAGDLAFWHWSIRLTSVANATLFANFAPLIVTLASWLFLGQRFSRPFLVGLALALGGAWLLMGDSLNFARDHIAGDALGIVTALFYGAYLISVGILRGRFGTFAVMFWSSLFSALALIPVTVLSGESFLPESAYGWAVLFGLGLICQAAGVSLITFALRHLATAYGAVSLMVQPIAAMVFGWLILSEAMRSGQMAAAAVVLAGILLASRRPPRLG